ncbi:integrin alpha-5 [Gambusia affinis]|uniref:integrin alpha-5 n=1 Tax=Gambusia affinis TaxID=33528 RepID=UPI001CDBDA37|nr:integrin alpha-5 [Gambusia affinis]
MGSKRSRVKTPGTATFVVRSSLCIIGLLATFSRPACEAFNLDVENPVVYSGPEGSYFGYAVDFYLSESASASVVIGAPKANTSQTNITEGGSVFYCPWSVGQSNCHTIEFDPEGDRSSLINGTIQQVDFKSHQWFGATVRSHGDTILACAPLYYWRTEKEEAYSDATGTCYLSIQNFTKFVEYAPCRTELSDRGGQGYCQGGFSADFTKDGRVVLGGPGSYYWQGQVISAAKKDIIKAYYPGYFMQAVKGQVQTRQIQASHDDSYQGYSVAVGEFSGDQVEDFVTGIPKGHLLYGLVSILNGSDLNTLGNFTGEQMGSYFGYALATTDINSDGMIDLLVGAPMFMVRTSGGRLEEMGRVYIYLQRSPLHLEITKPSLTGKEVFGRFGSTIAPLGDLNQDGFNDVAVSCPFGGDDRRGLVYIYNGYSEGLREKPSQVIAGQWAAGALPASFGFSLRGAQDLDMNGYPDLIVGAFGVNKAVLYRSRPIVSTVASLVVSPTMINPEEKSCVITSGNSSILVSCVNLSYCISAEGKHLPANLDFQVEVQLDSQKHKQKGAVRRALFLDSQQPLLQKRVRVRHGDRVCDQTRIYLRDEKEFRDKLSSIFVALNFSLDPEAASDSHGLRPILNYQTTNVIEQKAQILLDCGEDNICVPDLKLAVHSDRKEVYLGDDNSLTLTFNARNEGEGGAYEAELYVALPPDADYSGIARNNESLTQLTCSYDTENQTRYLSCDLGNPMKAGTNLWAGLRFTVPRLKDTHKTVQFYLQIRSKNENNSQSEVVYYNPEVVVQADVILQGVSRPDKVFFPPANWKVPKSYGVEQDVGPAVEHIYELVNNGPSRISDTLLELHCPLRIQGHDLLYPLEFYTEGPINCTADKNLNHRNLKLQRSSTESPVLALKADEHHVERRDVHKNSLAHLTNLSCSNADCWMLQCNVGLLEKGTTAILKMRSRVWAETFTEKAYKQYIMECLGRFNVKKMPYSILPKHYPSGQKKVVTPVVWNKPDIENSVPLWIIVLAILAGLLLLALLIYVLYRLGFFKRSLPYGTAMEKAQLKPQAASEA